MKIIEIWIHYLYNVDGDNMKLIKRKRYLNELNSVKGTPDIKVITGIRRSGKSKLMEAFIEQLINEDVDSNIIHINFNLNEFAKQRKRDALIKYVNSNYLEGKRNYLLIDEVQRCKGFEDAINGFHAEEKYDIYITGSNAFLMSNDLATLFTGRTYEIEVFPFSFSEYCEYYGYNNKYNAFLNYMMEGGMSGSYVYENVDQKYKYISDVYDTLILRDIIQKHKIKNPQMLESVSDYMMDNISNQMSIRNVTDEITNKEEPTTHRTIGKHISYLCESFAFYKIRRYDLKGKKYLSTNEKYYLADHSFKYAIQSTRNMDYGRVLENIVAIELLRRGYTLYTGTLYKKEIDFVAINHNQKLFIQVTQSMEDEATKQRELAPLLAIKEAYPKIIITRTGYMPYDIDGIIVIDIADWLLQE